MLALNLGDLNFGSLIIHYKGMFLVIIRWMVKIFWLKNFSITALFTQGMIPVVFSEWKINGLSLKEYALYILFTEEFIFTLFEWYSGECNKRFDDSMFKFIERLFEHPLNDIPSKVLQVLWKTNSYQ